MKKNDRVGAKKISYRLPFSFLNRDWRKFSLEELKGAHSFLYTLDYKLKNNCEPGYLDLFYMKLFNQKFNSIN